MKQIILNVKDNKYSYFLELLKDMDYIEVVQEIKDKKKSKIIQDLAEAFQDVRLHEQGKKKLTSAKDFLDEL